MNGYKINDNLYINCNNVDYVSFLNDKVKIHMNDNTSYYITQDQYADIETKIPQSGGSGGGASITANIKIAGNKDDILGTTEHNKLCILNDTGDLSFKVVDKIEGGVGSFIANSQLPDNIYKSVCGVYKNCIYFSGVYKLNVHVSYYPIYKYDINTNAITKIKR